MNRLAGCIDRGLDVSRDALGQVGLYAQDLQAVDTTLKPSDAVTAEDIRDAAENRELPGFFHRAESRDRLGARLSALLISHQAGVWAIDVMPGFVRSFSRRQTIPHKSVSSNIRLEWAYA